LSYNESLTGSVRFGDGSVVILRIKQAEMALSDGRLDEAYQLACDEVLRAHCRGQRLVDRLVRALVRRSGEHLAAGRLQQALMDCGKAQRLGGNLPAVAQLQLAVTEAINNTHQQHQRRQQVLNQAGRQIQQGNLSVGQQLLEQAAGNREAEAMLGEVADRRAAADAALKRAEKAIERKDWNLAIDELLTAAKLHSSSRRYLHLAGQVRDRVCEEIRSAMRQGRLALAEAAIARLKRLADGQGPVQELDRMLQQCRQASACIADGRVQGAFQILRQLTRLLPDAVWLKEALERCQQARQALETLQAGPLGMMTAKGSPTDEGIERKDPDLVCGEEKRSGPFSAGQSAVPRQFVIQVDGAGSFLVVRGGEVTVGPVSGSQPCDVGLLADPGLPVAKIQRVDEDYFVTSDRPIWVNEKTTTNSLLNKGDRIALSQRCRLRFDLPNAASTSAVLNLSGARLPQGDIRRVILLDRELIIQAGPAAHIPFGQQSQPLVLYVRDDRLCCRSPAAVHLTGGQSGASTAIPMDKHVQIGPVSLIVKRV